MDKLKRFLENTPAFLYLLPLFFVLHVIRENYGVNLIKDAFRVLSTYLIIALIFSIFFWLLLKNFHKANLMAFFVLAFNFFFGTTHDFLKQQDALSFFAKYGFLLPFFVFVFFALLLFLKKTKKKFATATLYLNSLLVLLVLVDLGSILVKSLQKNSVLSVKPISVTIRCDTCATPDIYFIVADEYAGKDELKDIFSFDNSNFYTQLKRRGFHIVNDSKSNYNYTVYSMASMFNMNYINNVNPLINQRDMVMCRKMVNRSNVLSFLRTRGYKIYNYSFFETDDHKSIISFPWLISENKFFTSQTFVGRFKRDLGFHFAKNIDEKAKLKTLKQSNIIADSMTRKIAKDNSPQAKLVYAHLAMPHHPFIFDSTGKETQFPDNHNWQEEGYVGYLVYTNRMLLSLIDHIQSASKKPPVILLMSDHGFRQFSKKRDPKYYFMNLNAVFFPDQNYSRFYDGMSNVNQFRVLFNTQFGLQLPLLKDSTSFLSESYMLNSTFK